MSFAVAPSRQTCSSRPPALIDMLIHDGKIVPGSAANIARAGVGVAYKAGGKRPS